MPFAGGQPSASPLTGGGGPSSQPWKKVPATLSPGAMDLTPVPTASTTPAPSESGIPAALMAEPKYTPLTIA